MSKPLSSRTADPIHEKNGEWYFWDETWSSEVGPYSTYALCKEALATYAQSLEDTLG